MTEPFDIEAFKLLDDEAAKTAQLAEDDAFVQGLLASVHAQLELRNAAPLWNPDITQTNRNIHDMVDTVVSMDPDEDEVSYRAEAEAAATRMAVGDVTWIAAIAIEKNKQKPDREAATLTLGKKILMARLLVRGYDQGWLDATNDLLLGEPLDITQEADLGLYIEASHELMDPEADPISDSLQSILFDSTYTKNADTQTKLAIETVGLARSIYKAQQNPAHLPNVIEKIETMKREGLLTDDEAHKLVQLLPLA